MLPEEDDEEGADVPAGLEFAWLAFWTLTGDRPQTAVPLPVGDGGIAIRMLPGKLPFQAVDCYARRYRIEGEAFETLAAVIRVLDSEYLAAMAEQVASRT